VNDESLDYSYQLIVLQLGGLVTIVFAVSLWCDVVWCGIYCVREDATEVTTDPLGYLRAKV